MDQEDYLKSRVDDQINWFDKKSKQAQTKYKLLRIIEILAAAAIPLIAGFAKEPFPVVLVLGLLGALIAVVSGMLSLNRYQENWTEYRKTSETLKQQKFLFLTKAAPYESDNVFIAFVSNVESILANENTSWVKSTNASQEQLNKSLNKDRA